MPNIIRRFFSTQFMVDDKLKCGDIIPSDEAYRSFLTIALPAVVEMVSMVIISMIDMAMVGALGPFAVASVGLATVPRMVFMTVFMALNVGVVAIVSRRKGQGDRESARACLRQSLMIEIGFALLLVCLAVGIAEPLMRLAGAQADTLGPSTLYFRITGIGILFQALSTTICSAQRGVGNTRMAMVVNLTANIVNVIFNFLLINGKFGFPRLEIAGAAIATVMGHAVGFYLALRSVQKKDAYLKISFHDNWKLDIPMIKILSRLSGSALIEQLAVRVGFFAYAVIVASLGTTNFAAHQIALQLSTFSYAFADGISVTAAAMVAQNLGKKRPDLSIMYGKIGQRFALVVSAFFSILSFVGTSFFPSLFTSDPEVIALAAGAIIALGLTQPFQTSQVVMGGSLRGAGDTGFVAWTMLVSVMIIRPGLSFIVIHIFHFGLAGVWYGLLVDQMLRAFLLFARFARGKWIDIKV